ncbi:MAG: hypothetical protein ACREOG_20970 [Gemmatimonadaceae bacterium]
MLPRSITATCDFRPQRTLLAERVSQLVASPLADRNVLLKFYSRERLMSPEARSEWVEPDIAVLRITDAR